MCSRRPFSLEETGPDQSAPAAWLNGLPKVGNAADGGKGKYTVAEGSLVSVMGACRGACKVQVKNAEAGELGEDCGSCAVRVSFR